MEFCSYIKLNPHCCSLPSAGNGQAPFVTEHPESPIPSWHLRCSSISSFPTALPRGDWEQLQSSAPAPCVPLPGSTQLVDSPCLRLWGELPVICYCMPGVSTPEERTGVEIKKKKTSFLISTRKISALWRW